MLSFSRSRHRRLRVWRPRIKNAHINTPEAGELYYPAQWLSTLRFNQAQLGWAATMQALE
jgi:hypothetical protein